MTFEFELLQSEQSESTSFGRLQKGPAERGRVKNRQKVSKIIFGPDVMQSGFGVNFLFWSGEFQENCRRISQRILMANFDSEIFGLFF